MVFFFRKGFKKKKKNLFRYENNVHFNFNFLFKYFKKINIQFDFFCNFYLFIFNISKITFF